MKCEKCSEREANFFYKETVNGKSTERRLCAECAREEGLDKAFDRRSRELFGGFERMFGGLFGPDPLEGFFAPRRMPAMTRTLLAPWAFAFPVFEIGPAEPESRETETADAKTAPESAAQADPELSRRRERNALRQQMEEAAKAENYERAIELREQLKALGE